MKLIKNKKGVALLLVLSAIVVLTTLMVEFAYESTISYKLALNERGRLKAEYLAKSAYNFMLLELKFDRVFRGIVQSQNLGQYLGANAQLPLCQQFPMSTGLIRAVFTGGGLLPGEEGEAGGEANAPESGAAEETGNQGETPSVEEMKGQVSISQEKSAQEFLEFEGDFDAECVDESVKVNLNGFGGLSVKPKVEGETSPFDQYKMYLIKFMSKSKFELLFKESDVKVTDVVNNIGDWIDVDTEMSSLGGRGGGAERLVYDKMGVKYSVRNGKLLTLLEAYLIDGVDDDWFGPMMEYFTVYGDGKVNVCTADPDVVEGLIYRYIDSLQPPPMIRLEDPEEMSRLTGSISDVCATGVSGQSLKQQVSQALDAAISAISSGQPNQSGQVQQTGTGGGQDKGFAAYIATEPRFFSLKLSGQVEDASVRIRTVVDVKEQDPKKWKVLYWRMF